MAYQRKTLPSTNIGSPGELPPEISGLSDASLADLSAALGAQAATELGFAGQGFFFVEPTPPTPPAPIISPYEFLLLFTTAERVAILTAAQTNMQMADWLNMLNHVASVHFDDENTIAGVHALESAGLIGTGRAAHILANRAGLMASLWDRLGRFLIGEDQAVNALGGGSYRETISGTVGRAVIAGKWWGPPLAYGIDGLLGEGHCARQAAKEAVLREADGAT